MLIQVEDRKLHNLLSREEYLKLPGLSFSMLKDQVIPETPGIRIGTLVHKYILKPKEYNYEEYDIVEPIARELIKYVGLNILINALCEVGVTATFILDGFTFLWKGIPDIGILNEIVIDFKIINGSLESYIKTFNYKNQLRGYMHGFGARVGIIIAWNKVKKIVEVAYVDRDDRWWGEIIRTRGSIL